MKQMINTVTQSTHAYKSFFYNVMVIRQIFQRLQCALSVFVMALAVSFVSLVTPSIAQSKYQVSTGLPTSDFYPVSVAMKTLLRLKRTNNWQIELNTHQSSGSKASLIELLEGRTDIAFVDASTIVSALTQKPPFDRYKNISKLQALVSLWPDVAHLVLREQQVRDGTIYDFKNLISENVSFGMSTTQSSFASRSIFSQLDIEYNKMFRVLDYNIYQTTEAFIEDRISGISFFTHDANENIEQVLANPETNATLLNVSDEQLKKLNTTRIPVWHRHVIAANTYTNQPEPVETIAQANFLVVMQDFNEQDAYKFTKTLFDNLTFVRTLHGAAYHIHREASTSEQILPLHRGSERYFTETEECTGIFCLFN